MDWKNSFTFCGFIRQKFSDFLTFKIIIANVSKKKSETYLLNFENKFEVLSTKSVFGSQEDIIYLFHAWNGILIKNSEILKYFYEKKINIHYSSLEFDKETYKYHVWKIYEIFNVEQKKQFLNFHFLSTTVLLYKRK